MRQTIQVDVLLTDEATVAEVRGGTYLESNPTYVAQGYAKKHPKDNHDAEVGHSLAMARALKALAETYEQRAWDRINNPRHYTYATGGMLTTAPKFSYDTEGKFDHKWLDSVLRGEKIGRIK